MDVAEGRELVLLDTDIGSDIDDSLCLAYLLHEPRCDLLGITTVTGDTKKRASCCDAVCRAAGRTDVPIHPGATDVLLSGPGQPDVPRFAGLQGRHAFRTDWPEHLAVDFLRHTIHTHPGEITLLGIGPLTNIALLCLAAGGTGHGHGLSGRQGDLSRSPGGRDRVPSGGLHLRFGYGERGDDLSSPLRFDHLCAWSAWTPSSGGLRGIRSVLSAVLWRVSLAGE